MHHCTVEKMSINKIGILFTSPAEGTVVNYKVIRIFTRRQAGIMFLSHSHLFHRHENAYAE